MPFTLAHPAAVLPVRCLLRRQTVLSALVIGSMTPDFAYFLPLGVTGTQTHSLAGLLWFCMPVGLTAFLLFRALLRRPLIHLMPRAIRVRLTASAAARLRVTWGAAIAVLASLAIGAITHVDAFTHRTGAAVRAWPALGVTLFTIGPHNVRLYMALQYGCTALGLVVIACWCWYWLRRTPPPETEPVSPLSPAERVVLVAGLTAFPVVVGLTTAVMRAPDRLTLAALRSFADRAVVSGMTACFAVLIALGLLWPILEARTRARRERP